MDFFVYRAAILNFTQYALQRAHAPSWGWVGPTVNKLLYDTLLLMPRILRMILGKQTILGYIRSIRGFI